MNKLHPIAAENIGKNPEHDSRALSIMLEGGSVTCYGDNNTAIEIKTVVRELTPDEVLAGRRRIFCSGLEDLLHDYADVIATGLDRIEVVCGGDGSVEELAPVWVA